MSKDGARCRVWLHKRGLLPSSQDSFHKPPSCEGLWARSPNPELPWVV